MEQQSEKAKQKTGFKPHRGAAQQSLHSQLHYNFNYDFMKINHLYIF